MKGKIQNDQVKLKTLHDKRKNQTSEQTSRRMGEKFVQTIPLDRETNIQ